jgi:hypothetical protein
VINYDDIINKIVEQILLTIVDRLKVAQKKKSKPKKPKEKKSKQKKPKLALLIPVNSVAKYIKNMSKCKCNLNYFFDQSICICVYKMPKIKIRNIILLKSQRNNSFICSKRKIVNKQN